MPADRAQIHPSQVAAEGGEIIVDGPDGVAVTLSADAAEETARRLLDAVAVARGQSPRNPPVDD